MSDSYILTVEKALSDIVERTVTTANGRDFDLTGVVYRGRQRYGHNEPCPMVSMLQAPNIDLDNDNVGTGTIRKSNKSYLIQGWADDDSVNPTDPAHALLAEVKRALSPILDMDHADYMLKSYNTDNSEIGLIEDINISTGLVRPPEMQVSEKAYFWLPVIVTFVENISDPCQLPS